MSKSELLKWTEDDRKKILEYHNRTLESAKEDVKTIKNWLEMQPHLPEVTSDERIANFLLMNKYSVEAAKEKLDMYYTIRGIMPDLYSKMADPFTDAMKELNKTVYWLPLPILSKDCYRITILKLINDDPDKSNPMQFFAYTLNVAEIRLFEDCGLADVFIYDLEYCRVGHLTKLSPVSLKKLISLTEKIYSNGLKEIHFINPPTFFESFIVLLKTLLKPKMMNKVFVHKDISSLYEYIPKEILPRDYGGSEKSLEELNDAWQAKFLEYKPWFDKLKTFEVNEQLRPKKTADDEILGVHGNFKKLEVD